MTRAELLRRLDPLIGKVVFYVESWIVCDYPENEPTLKYQKYRIDQARVQAVGLYWEKNRKDRWGWDKDERDYVVLESGIQINLDQVVMSYDAALQLIKDLEDARIAEGDGTAPTQ